MNPRMTQTGQLTTESNVGGLLDDFNLNHTYDAFLRRSNMELKVGATSDSGWQNRCQMPEWSNE